MTRTRTITQIGYMISGIAYVSMWGGGNGQIEMSKEFLPNELMSKDNMLRCVNDNGFGVESIDTADIIIGIKYDNGSIEWDHEIEVTSPIHAKLFLGWYELNKQKEKLKQNEKI